MRDEEKKSGTLPVQHVEAGLQLAGYEIIRLLGVVQVESQASGAAGAVYHDYLAISDFDLSFAVFSLKQYGLVRGCAFDGRFVHALPLD